MNKATTEAIQFQPPHCAQGDLSIIAVDKIPDDLKEKSPEEGKHILAHSETGHHHVIDGNCARVFQQDDFISYMEVKEETNIIHLRSFDTHRPIAMPPGLYRLSQQRQYIPGGFIKAAD